MNEPPMTREEKAGVLICATNCVSLFVAGLTEWMPVIWFWFWSYPFALATACWMMGRVNRRKRAASCSVDRAG